MTYKTFLASLDRNMRTVDSVDYETFRFTADVTWRACGSFRKFTRDVWEQYFDAGIPFVKIKYHRDE